MIVSVQIKQFLRNIKNLFLRIGNTLNYFSFEIKWQPKIIVAKMKAFLAINK
jgi:hypothetical protein